MKKLIALLLLAAMVLSLAGCSGYVSSYRATFLITESTRDHCRLSADSFDGKYIFQLRYTGEDDALSFSASVGEGSVTISYAVGNDETPLCSLQSGEAVTDRADLPEHSGRGTIYVIIQTDGKATDLKVTADLGEQSGNFI